MDDATLQSYGHGRCPVIYIQLRKNTLDVTMNRLFANAKGGRDFFVSHPTRDILHKLWDRQHLHDSIIRLLAIEPIPGEGPMFLQGLTSFDPEIVRLSARSLEKLNGPSVQAELAAAIKALRRTLPEDKTTREAILSLLKFGPAAKDSVPVLTEALKDSDAKVRQYAEKALAQVQRAG